MCRVYCIVFFYIYIPHLDRRWTGNPRAVIIHFQNSKSDETKKKKPTKNSFRKLYEWAKDSKSHPM